MVLFPPPFYFVFYISNLLSYIQNNFSYELARPIMGTIFLGIIGERAKRVRHSQVCSIENRGYIYIQVKKKAFKINAKIEDVGLNED